jgi:two-component sensor histidine kinase
LGETNVSEIRLGPNENQIQIDFVGLSFGTAEQVKYQFKLEGADTDWTAPTEQRSVNYARLAPGSYRFLVRAMRDGNAVSQSPATVAFTIMPPVWQRWWFLLLVAVLIGFMAYTLYRYRLVRLLELERVRTRIATDLHDDIGSNLSLIAMASEVASRQAHNVDDRMAGWLSLISDTSRETVDSMSDIVWAVNPAKDRLIDLVQRMRRVAEEALTAKNIAFHFSAPDEETDTRLSVDTRREVFMVFKEGINNIAHHSHATKADLSMKLEDRLLVLELADNGRGFDPTSAGEGNGLASMRRRAQKLRGKLEIDSNPGKGTKIRMTVPA